LTKFDDFLVKKSKFEEIRKIFYKIGRILIKKLGNL